MEFWDAVVTPVVRWFVDWKVLVGAALSGGIFLLLHWRKYPQDAVTINLPFNLGSRVYTTTPADRAVAWKLYTELKTRKAALPFDEHNDIIVEVYDSLYSLFGITRNLLLALPSQEFSKEDGIANLILRVQNDGVRPHLTKWQGKFRRWWKNTESVVSNRDLSPQELQRTFPQYRELVEDLARTNTELSKFADDLLCIARPPKKKLWTRPTRSVSPQPPTLEHSEAVASVADDNSNQTTS